MQRRFDPAIRSGSKNRTDMRAVASWQTARATDAAVMLSEVAAIGRARRLVI